MIATMKERKVSLMLAVLVCSMWMVALLIPALIVKSTHLIIISVQFTISPSPSFLSNFPSPPPPSRTQLQSTILYVYELWWWYWWDWWLCLYHWWWCCTLSSYNNTINNNNSNSNSDHKNNAATGIDLLDTKERRKRKRRKRSATYIGWSNRRHAPYHWGIDIDINPSSS